MVSRSDSNKQRLRRHKRVRSKIFGTAQRPRFDVYRSENNIYVQIIDDDAGVTLVSASSTEKEYKALPGNKETAAKIGKLAAERALQKGITEVVFDRGEYLYHGRVQALAEAAREAGLKF